MLIKSTLVSVARIMGRKMAVRQVRAFLMVQLAEVYRTSGVVRGEATAASRATFRI